MEILNCFYLKMDDVTDNDDITKIVFCNDSSYPKHLQIVKNVFSELVCMYISLADFVPNC